MTTETTDDRPLSARPEEVAAWSALEFGCFRTYRAADAAQDAAQAAVDALIPRGTRAWHAVDELVSAARLQEEREWQFYIARLVRALPEHRAVILAVIRQEEFDGAIESIRIAAV
ncbi:MAG TPA: hypothetical protein VKV26_08875 [Dehalococcoidia bacterium]|nr:hypothetical protein [Dehalococcoidia bacterium]